MVTNTQIEVGMVILIILGGTIFTIAPELLNDYDFSKEYTKVDVKEEGSEFYTRGYIATGLLVSVGGSN